MKPGCDGWSDGFVVRGMEWILAEGFCFSNNGYVLPVHKKRDGRGMEPVK